jgi:hypothetical protein
MSWTDPTRPNAYTFAAAFKNRGFGTGRKGVTMFWLSFMPRTVQKQYGLGELNDADIMRRADEMRLPCTRTARERA